MPDTWGISGPAFLVYYLGAMVGLIVLALLHNKIRYRGRSDARVDQLGPQQLAYLNGGRQLAVYTALGGLRAAGAIGTGSGHSLVQTGRLPVGSTPLDSAIYNAAGRGIKAREVQREQWVATALDQLHDGLEADGLVASVARLRESRLWALGGLTLLVIGVARLVTGIRTDKPIGLLIPLLFLTLLMTAVLAGRRRRPTHAATRGLEALRRANKHLAPQQSPAYATYGVTGAAMGVALFGAASLYSMDPAFAADAEILRAAATGGGSSGTDSGGGSCGGGGGGGGGGCCGGCGG